MTVRLEEDHPSLVVLGGFDPLLFHPQWFRSEGLLGKEETEQAEVKVIHPEVAHWSTDWLEVQVTPGRFLARANVESAADSLRDIVMGTLQVLDKTRTTALGLNRSMHFDVGGEDNWHRVGHTLAPKALWSQHLKQRPGMKLLQIEQTQRDDGLAGKVVVSVQPSTKYKHGVFFDVNNEVSNAQNETGTAVFVTTIREHWKRLFDESRSMAESVLRGALA